MTIYEALGKEKGALGASTNENKNE